MKIPFSELPNVSRLAADYFDDFDKVSSFYNGDYRKPENFLDRAGDIKARDLPLAKLAPVLKEQNQTYGCGLPTLEKIDWLLERRACAVVTGQQTGLFGGPLLTVHKALTAIRLAERLSRTCEGCYVPVFWLASDDHDFREVNHCVVLGKDNKPLTITYDGHPADSRVPVSRVVIGEEIAPALEALAEATHPSEFKDEILAHLNDAYQPGVSFSDAFAKWMMSLFQQFGLIIIDAADPRIKALGKELFRREIDGASPSSARALATSKKLVESGYHAQVPLKENFLNLFYAETERVSLQAAHGSYLAKSLNRTFQSTELLAILEERPEFFSPNVLLRPLYQDLLLPTIAYIAGPSELAYYAQMKGIYEAFGSQMPVIYPRKSLTILEGGIEKILDRYGLRVRDFWVNMDALLNQVARQHLPEGLEGRIAAAATAIESTLAELETVVSELDPTLLKFSQNTRGRILSQVQGFEKKALQAFKKRNEVIGQQLHRAGGALYPHGGLQERELNITPYLFKHGFGFIDQLYEAMDISNLDHQIVRV